MWKLIATPIIGAIIGYITNWLAVKMLFRPRHEVRIGGWKVPFTPGVIPKGQPRLAKAVGEVVEKQLLTKEVMEEMLLSEEMKQKVAAAVSNWLEEQKETEITIRESVLSMMEEEDWEDVLESIKENGSAHILESLMAQNPGKILSEKILEIARQKLAESMFGMMIGGGFLDSIADMLVDKINEYLQENGQDIIKAILENEIENLENKTTGEIIEQVEHSGVDLTACVVALYEKMIREHIGAVMDAIHFSKIVEDRINSMQVEEVEELMLKIMKKELGAIVNLGALIGFLLGLANLVILYI